MILKPIPEMPEQAQ